MDFLECNGHYQISNGRVSEGSRFLLCGAVLLGQWFQTFLRNILPLFWRFKASNIFENEDYIPEDSSRYYIILRFDERRKSDIVSVYLSECVVCSSLFILSFLLYRRPLCIHSSVCLTTGPQPLPKRVIHRVRSNDSSFNLLNHLFFLRSSSNCLRLIPHLPVTSILSSMFSSVTCFRRQFLPKNLPLFCFLQDIDSM